jgi:hypothetical protein
MGEFLFFLGIGFGSLGLLFLWAKRTVGSRVDPTKLSEVHEVLTIVELELPSRALGERIFALEDWDFTSANTSNGIQRMFLKERKLLAVSWLQQTRSAVGRMMKFHRKAVRGDIRLSPSLELRLALDYVLFLLTYEILCGLIWLRGPYCVRSIFSYTAGIADQVSYLSGQFLVGLDAARLGRIKSRWISRPVVS